jgi:seryl-tRNA(Sec) selenium transferase
MEGGARIVCVTSVNESEREDTKRVLRASSAYDWRVRDEEEEMLAFLQAARESSAVRREGGA